MKEGLAPVWEELNELMSKKSIVIKGEKEIELKFSLGGDYKVAITV